MLGASRWLTMNSILPTDTYLVVSTALRRNDITRIHIHTYTSIHAYIHSHTHTYMYSHARIHLHPRTYAPTYTYTYAHTHANEHLHLPQTHIYMQSDISNLDKWINQFSKTVIDDTLRWDKDNVVINLLIDHPPLCPQPIICYQILLYENL